MKPRQSLRTNVIPKPPPETRTIFDFTVSPGFKGKGDIDWLCGNCGTVLAEAVWRLSLQNIVFRYPKCGAYSTPVEAH